MSASHTAINSAAGAAAIPAFNAAIFPRETGQPKRDRPLASFGPLLEHAFACISGTVVDEHGKQPIGRIVERSSGRRASR